MPNKENYKNIKVGDQHGIYTVLAVEEMRTPIYSSVFKCQCVCGNICNRTAESLLKGKAKTCRACASKRKNNKIIERNGWMEIVFDDDPRFIRFSKEDLPKILEKYWNIDAQGYAVSCTGASLFNNGSTYKMHRFLLNTPDNMVGDHRYGVKLDNRRDYIRNCTHKDNVKNRVKLQSNNTSGYAGVYQRKNGMWTAQIQVDGHMIHLGTVFDKEEAILLRQLGEEKYFGEFSTDLERCEQEQKRYNKEVYWRKRLMLENERAKEHERLEKEGWVLTAEEDVLLDYELCSNY